MLEKISSSRNCGDSFQSCDKGFHQRRASPVGGAVEYQNSVFALAYPLFITVKAYLEVSIL